MSIAIDVAVKKKLNVDIDVTGSTRDRAIHYDGEYEITPSTQQQVFSTEDKMMDYNFKVKGIPYREELNASGGTTAVIGETVND